MSSSWGHLFTNRFKGTNTKAPDLTGQVTIDDTERVMVAWWRVGRSGKRYLNVEIKDPTANNDQGDREPRSRPRRDTRVRTGRNAPTPDEAAQVAALDKVLQELNEHEITALNIADTLGVSRSAISHLRTNLTAFSFSQRQAAKHLLLRFLTQFEIVRRRWSPDGADAADSRAHADGRGDAGSSPDAGGSES